MMCCSVTVIVSGFCSTYKDCTVLYQDQDSIVTGLYCINTIRIRTVHMKPGLNWIRAVLYQDSVVSGLHCTKEVLIQDCAVQYQEYVVSRLCCISPVISGLVLSGLCCIRTVLY
jgi:hypothetical protein